MTQFGDRLRQFRQAQGLSLDDLASATGISRAYLWKLERKPDVNPSLDRLQKLADALGTSVGDLAGETPQEATKTRGVPLSLKHCQDKYKLSEQDVSDLSQIRFRGGHPTDPDDWFALFLQLKRFSVVSDE